MPPMSRRELARGRPLVVREEQSQDSWAFCRQFANRRAVPFLPSRILPYNHDSLSNRWNI